MKKSQLQLAFLFLLATALSFSACKEDEIDLLDPIPQIINVTVNPTTVVEFEDEITFSVEYRDGDGDLGENDPNVTNLFVIDNRVGITESFRVSQLAPDNANVPITGTLQVILPSTGITDNSTSQTVNYTIYMVDRAGNESNRFTTGDITVNGG